MAEPNYNDDVDIKHEEIHIKSTLAEIEDFDVENIEFVEISDNNLIEESLNQPSNSTNMVCF